MSIKIRLGISALANDSACSPSCAITTENPLRWSLLDNMSRFISLSSTSKIFGIKPLSDLGVASPMFGVVRSAGHGYRVGSSDARNTSDPVLFYKNCKAFAVNRLDEIVRGA